MTRVGRRGLALPRLSEEVRSHEAVIAIAVTGGLAFAVAPMYVAALTFAAVALAAFWVAPAWCIALVLAVRASLDTSGAYFSVGGTNAAGFVALFVAACGGVALLRRPSAAAGPRDRSLPKLGVLALAITVAVTGILHSPLPSEAVSEATRFASLAVLYLHVRRITLAGEERRYVWVPIALGTLVPLVVAAAQTASGNLVSKQGFDAVASTFTHPNGFACYLFVVATLLLAYPERPGRTAFVPQTILPTTLFAALIITYTRSVWGVALLGLVAVVATSRKSLALGLAAGVVVLVVLEPAIFEPLVGRFADLSATSSDYSGNSLAWRETLWSAMWPLTLTAPIFGHGLSSFPQDALAVMGPHFGYAGTGATAGIYAHNEYLNVAYQLGAAGLLVVFATLAAHAGRIGRGLVVCRQLTVAAISIVLGLLVVAYTDNVLAYTGAMTYVAAMLGLWAGTVDRALPRHPPGGRALSTIPRRS
jgi:hypothetical protein